MGPDELNFVAASVGVSQVPCQVYLETFVNYGMEKLKMQGLGNESIKKKLLFADMSTKF